jgi:hypothetical protein
MSAWKMPQKGGERSGDFLKSARLDEGAFDVSVGGAVDRHGTRRIFLNAESETDNTRAGISGAISGVNGI